MNPKRFTFVFVSVAICFGLLIFGSPSRIGAQGNESRLPAAPMAVVGTAFTYQGRLTDGGAPADGIYNFRFYLWSDEIKTTLLGTYPGAGSVGIQVADGYFDCGLDFGLEVFDGEERWLEIEVNGSLLSPLQPLTPTPYAIHALTAPWSGLTDVPDDLEDGDDDTTYTPGYGLDLAAGAFSVNPAEVQDRVDGSCPAGQSIRVINADGTVVCELDNDTTSFWNLSGNAGTNPGTDYLGTSDNQALVLSVNSARALRIEPSAGSPNLIGGYSGNSVTAGVYGAIIGGGGDLVSPNRVTDNFSTVGGGRNNQAGDNDGTLDNAIYATVCGGVSNHASGSGATISGGSANTASGPGASVGGGYFNAANGSYGTVGGGDNNIANNIHSTVGGGYANFAYGDSSTIAGGNDNYILSGSTNGTISGGEENLVTDEGGTVGGGYDNQAGNYSGGSDDANYVYVGGGYGNAGSAHSAVVAGGYNNTAGGGYSFIGGGDTNATSGGYSSIGGGRYNSAAGLSATVAGGEHNQALGDYAMVGGGGYNTASGSGSVIAGGGGIYGTDTFTNTASGDRSSILGGVNNTAGGSSSSIGGGEGNTASRWASTVSGGSSNTASNLDSAVGGGANNIASGASSTVGGGWSNKAESSGSTVSGGDNNTANGDYSTVGGGTQNTATDNYTTVGGGELNEATSPRTTVAGGYSNAASNWNATVAGGNNNTASGGGTFVGGGDNNTASGAAATVPGGANNNAQGSYSFAAGRRAKGYNNGCFVWGDSTDADVECNNNNRWVVRSSGGVYFYSNSGLTSGTYMAAGANSWSGISDRRTKENFLAVDAQDILDELAAIPVREYNLKSQDPAIRHIGLVAQDFATFGYGESDLAINMQDADGIALVAIQGLYDISQDQAAQIENLQVENASLRRQLGGSVPGNLSHPLSVLVYALSGLVLLLLIGFIWMMVRMQNLIPTETTHEN